MQRSRAPGRKGPTEVTPEHCCAPHRATAAVVRTSLRTWVCGASGGLVAMMGYVISETRKFSTILTNESSTVA